jgi:HAE1 family hydrophobic/amphiphilic exporter-1
VATIRSGEAGVAVAGAPRWRQALAIDVVKQQGSNTVEVAQAIRAAVEELNAQDMPPGVTIDIVQDNAVEVEESYQSVQNMLIEGPALRHVIVFLFLNSWRLHPHHRTHLPISVIGTMTVLYALGLHAEHHDAAGAEPCHRPLDRRRDRGAREHRAAPADGQDAPAGGLEGTTRSARGAGHDSRPSAVFLPVAFMEGILGRFFLQFGVTVSVRC